MSWILGCKHFPEAKEKMRKASLGRVISPETREKMRKASLGRVISPEIRKNMRKAHLGCKRSPESVEKTRQAHLGLKHSSESKEKMCKAKLGHVVTPETREKICKAQLGHVVSKETREKISKSSLGRVITLETREKLRKGRLRYFETHDIPTRDTLPERLVEDYLKKLGVKYIKQKFIEGSPVDFYLPYSKTIIEVDGCLWHACEKCFPKPDGWICKTYDDVVNVHMKDALKDNKWLDRGYKVIRIWEHDALKGNFKVLEIKGE